MGQLAFNDAGTLSYTPTVSDGAVTLEPSSLISVSLYLTAPTDAQRNDDSNALGAALQHITTWNDGRSVNEKTITVAAITDPDPTNTKAFEIYYAVWRYRLESGASTIRDVEPFVIYRVEGIQSRTGVTNSDIFVVERKLEDLISSAEITDKILLAERLVNQTLRSRGLDVQKLQLLDAKDLVRYKTLVLCCLDLSNSPNDEWMMKSIKYEDYFRVLLDGLALGYDSDSDGDIEPGENIKNGVSSGIFFR